MRSSKLSKDASKLLDGASASPPARRIVTRSLSRFAYAAVPPTSGRGARAPDMEDGIAPPAKRRRRVSEDGGKPEAAEEAAAAVKAPRRARRPARKATDPETGAPTVTPPSDWEAVYDAVRKMRAPGGVAYGAAVDTMGCERLADRQASPRDQRFHTLVALMLSSQTKDTVNAVAMQRLKTELPAHAPGAPAGLTLDNMLAVDATLLNELIRPVGFHNNKTKYLKQAAVMLRDQWGGDIPDSVEGLTSLPGVGPKMAYLCMSAAWNRTEGIGVDVHVHRITNLWGWQKTKTAEETRVALQAWLPRDRWREINALLVGLGQAVCLPVGRRCGDCELGLGGLCRAADGAKVAAGRRLREAAAGEAAGEAVGRRLQEAAADETTPGPEASP